jgi:putative acetyltransferase
VAAIISLERPDTTDARALIDELEAYLTPMYPAESRHGYSVDKLLARDVAFFVVREDGVPAGCGGIELFDSDYGEIKRMFVRPKFRGLGLAKLILQQLTDYAVGRGVKVVRLETGIHQHEAIGLYEQMGFRTIPPFGNYRIDPLSCFYEKRL